VEINLGRADSPVSPVPSCGVSAVDLQRALLQEFRDALDNDQL
jgi:hypothetical protein